MCFLHSYIQSPQAWGWAPGPRLCSQPSPPHPLVPGIWSAKQTSIRINKPLAPSLWSRGHLQRGLERLTSPCYCCGPEDQAPATRTQAYRSQEADKTNTGKLGPLLLACLLTSHSPASRHCTKVAGRGLGPTCGRARTGREQGPAALLLSLTSRL